MAEEWAGGDGKCSRDRFLPQQGQHLPQVLLLDFHPRRRRHLLLPGGALEPGAALGEGMESQHARAPPGNCRRPGVWPGSGCGHRRHHHGYRSHHQEQAEEGNQLPPGPPIKKGQSMCHNLPVESAPVLVPACIIYQFCSIPGSAFPPQTV